MSTIEIFGVILSILGVVFTAQKKMIAWYINIVASLVYGYIFYTANLYADAELQIFFIASAVYGIFQWNKSKGNWQASSSSLKSLLLGLIISIVAGTLLGKFHATYTQNVSFPYFDGILTAGSIWATYLAAHQKRENWMIWIVIDAMYVVMYFYKDLYLTAGLYGLFVLLAWRGLFKWKVKSEE